MFWLVSVHLSVHTRGVVPRPGPFRGGTPARSNQGGTLCWGTPPRVPPMDLAGGTWWGYPTLGTPQSDLATGYPTLGYPPIGPGWGVPWWGYPTLGITPIGPGGGYPDGRGYPTLGAHLLVGPGLGGYPTSVVLDTPRSVCLLRSRRRTFSFLKV